MTARIGPKERQKVVADLGPVRCLALLIGANNERVMRWFILAVALLLDPAAVLLLLAATRRPGHGIGASSRFEASKQLRQA
jgi:hypothetical protein